MMPITNRAGSLELEMEGRQPAVNQGTMPGMVPRIPIEARLGAWVAPMILIVTDYIAIVLALASMVFIRSTLLSRLIPGLSSFGFGPGDRLLYYTWPLVFMGLLCYEGMYSRRMPIWKCAEKLFKVCFYAAVLSIGYLFFTDNIGWMSRLFVLLSGLVAFIYLTLARYLVKHLLSRLGLWQKPVIVVGAGRTAELLARGFAEESNIGYRIIGFVDDRPPGEAGNPKAVSLQPIIGRFDDIERVIKSSGVRDAIIAAPGLSQERLVRLAGRIQPLVKRLIVVPNLFGMPLTNIEVETLFNQKTILLAIKNNLANPWNRFVKRLLDITLVLLALIPLLPVMAIIAILIHLDSPGNAFFAHKRIGRGGKTFGCLKFRSMVKNSQEVLQSHLANNPKAREEWERDFKLRNDPRITRIGRFLRKTSLDELPQLINILKGEMSLVGPRPIIDQEIKKYGNLINDYYMVRPGLTGLWQTSGRNDIDYETRVKMDSWYTRNWSVWLDLVMIMKTVKVVLRRHGAY